MNTLLYMTATMVWVLVADATLPATPGSCNVSRISRSGKFLYGGNVPDYHVPTTEEGFKAWCKELAKAGNEVHNYLHECVKPTLERLASHFVDQSTQHITRTCTSSPGANLSDFFQHLPCYAAVVRTLNDCETDYMITLLSIAEKVDKNQIVDYSCCALYEVLKCVSNMQHKNCPDNTMDFTTGMVGNIYGNLHMGKCVTPHEECAKLPPIKKVDPPEYDSVLSAMLAVLTKFYGE